MLSIGAEFLRSDALPGVTTCVYYFIYYYYHVVIGDTISNSSKSERTNTIVKLCVHNSYTKHPH